MNDVMIVGAGPAGLTAALYAGRSKLKTRVFEKLASGGQMLLTELIENYPGVPQMRSHAWVEMTKKQLAELKDVELQEGVNVEKIESVDGHFRTTFASPTDGLKATAESRCLIIASGAVPKKMGIPGEEALVGRGVSYCATCDGPLFKHKDIVVIGGGDTAIEEALYLRKFGRKVTVVHRRQALRASAVLRDRVLADEKIQFKWDSVPVEVKGKARVEALRIRNVKTNSEEDVLCEGIFVFIGFSPDTAFCKGFLDSNEAGFILTDESMATSRPGVFACGDCRSRPFNQVVTACSEGAIAAFSAVKFLETKA